ncbi:UNVERIFIED_CONTAM: hypothetical protein NCL1_38895 [Trichonephila clavipes]
MIIITGRLVQSEVLSSSLSKCIGPACNRFINTASVKEASLARAVPHKEDASSEDALKEKEIEIQTCGKLFEKWRKEKKFWSVPKSNITFRVKYIDTGHQGEGAVKPTIISLHGSPGNYKEFNSITASLCKKGVRVIAPNFPGSEIIQPSVFRHTPEEKAEFIRDFLRALRIPSVDMVLCHSSALFPGLQLSLDNKDISVNSLALINPTGLEIPRLLQPVWLTKPLTRLSEFPMGYQLTKMVGQRLAKKPELKGGTFEEHFLSAFTLLHSNIPKKGALFQTLLDQNFPVFMAFSHNDKLISRKTSYKMADMMVLSKDIVTYDKDGKPNGSGGVNPFRKVMAFEKGSHFLTRTYPDIVSEAVSSFLFQQFENRVK